MSLPSRLQKARLTLLLDFPFFGQLALRLRPEIDPTVETAETDGRVIKFNPDFCGALTDPELAWLYAHEVGHPALGHNWRLGGRDPDKANIAADYVVNEMLQNVIDQTPGAENRLRRIANTYLDAKYFGMSFEQIYHLLPEPARRGDAKPAPPPQPNSQNSSNSRFKSSGSQDSASPKTVGTFVPPEPSANGDADSHDPTSKIQNPTSGAAGAALETEWKQAVAQAATVARMKGQGQLPAAIEQLISDLFEPAVPWQDLLRQFASQITRDDYSWRRPNRRFVAAGIMLPTLRTESLGEIVVAVDTSGSIYGCPELLKSFLSELQGILDQCHPIRILVIDCDAAVHAITEYRHGDDLRDHRFRGGGGTRFEPVFEYVAREDLEPAALLYFTDLYGSFPDQAPPYPTLWLNYEDPTNHAPFGQTVHVSPTAGRTEPGPHQS